MMDTEAIKRAAEAIEAILPTMPEEITPHDLMAFPQLHRLVLLTDRLDSLVTRQALEWAKTREVK